MTTRYVRHISGQGERWPVVSETPERWIVDYQEDEFANALNLPKSEYVLVEPPERWVDVTEHCEIGKAVTVDAAEKLRESMLERMGDTAWTDIFHPANKDKYRLRKVYVKVVEAHTLNESPIQHAFLVEKKETP